MAYTPGPWKVKMHDNYMRLYMPGPLKGDVARGYVGEDNARLIAAAPDLLEALEALIPQVWTALNDGCVSSKEEYENALLVIEKVKAEVSE